METISQKKIRAQNILQVCELIFSREPLSRYEISQETGVSIMTVGKVVEILKRADVIYEVKDESSPVGRKAGKIHTSDNRWSVALIDLCQEEMACCLMPIGGSEVTEVLRRPLARDGCEEMLDGVLEEFRDKLSLSGIVGIGVLVPGPYCADRDIVINRRLPQLTNLPLGAILGRHFSGLPVVIEEDVKFAARYAMRRVPGYENKTIFYAYVGEGVGGAILQNAEVFRSAYSYSADFGQFKLSDGTTVESVISLSRFGKRFPGVCAGVPPVGGERDALRLYMRQVEQALVQCLDNIMWLLDPDEIIFDSEYDRLLPGFFDQLSSAFLKRAAEERGEYIPRFSRFQAGENALYKGARNSVRELFFQSLA